MNLDIFGSAWYILIGLLGFGLLVVWHELGHFLLAKFNGVYVEEFSIGMGKKLFGFKGKETEYTIRLLPIGGYVRMLGEEGECTDPRAFTNKSNLRRLSIVSAGPIFNFILAIVLFGVFYSNVGVTIPEVDKLTENRPAVTSGIEIGDRIIEANDKKIDNWTDFSYFMSKNSGEDIHLKLERDGDIVEKVITPEVVEEDGSERYVIGIEAKTIDPGFVSALKLGAKEVGSSVKMTFDFFARAFKGQASKDDVGGPVTILKMTGRVAKQGVLPLLFFLGLISTQLAIFNILPIPALDGGWIVILILQMITGKKFKEELVGKINYFGFLFLLALMVIVTIKDLFFPAAF